MKLRAEDGQLRIRAPRGAVDDALRARLAESKAALLALLERDGGAAEALPQAVPDPARRHEPFPLTDIQEAYWIGSSAGLDAAGGYHYYLEFDCPPLDLTRLEQAWQTLVARHEMLRAVILPDGTQRILRDVPPWRIAVHDLRARADAEQALAAIRELLAHREPALDRWPLSQVEVSLLPGGGCRVHVSLGLITLDSFSMMILFDEWQRLYRDPAHALPPLPTSFRDYVLAERRLAETAQYRRAERYWLDRLDDLPPAPALPAAPRRGNGPASTRFRRLTAELDAPRWEALKRRAARFGVTPSALLLAAFSEVLATWSATPRFTLNLTLFNRLPLGEGIGRVVGDFTSVTLLAVDFGTRRPFAEHAAAVNRQLREDLEHRAYPGVRALREWAKRTGSAGTPLAPVVFSSTLVLDTAADFSLGRLFGGRLVDAISQTPQCHLDHQLMEDEGRLVFHWDVLEGHYPDGMVEAMFEAYAALLARLAESDEAFTETRGPLLPPAQAARHAAANATDAPVPQETLAGLFAARVAERGEAPAVIAPGLTLSYAALDRRARALAHRLRGEGGGLRREEPVAILMEKGWAQVVAVLATAMAGGAWMPVDAAAPPLRRAGLLAQAGVRVVLTQAALRDAAQADAPPGARVIAVDALPEEEAPPLPPGAASRPEELAYVLFTSGSTGTPKGVMIETRSVVHRMQDVVRRFGLGPEDRAIGLTALHHDLSVFDIAGVLCCAGGALVLPAAEGLREPAHWDALMRAHGVTLWNSVPAFLGMLADHLETAGEGAPPLPLRWCILSGDFIPVALPDRMRAAVPGLAVVAAGGPTETTVWDICNPLGAVDPGLPSIPYGRPMANARYHVLKDNLDPCPDWTPGELCIAGIGLARGYLGDPAGTAERFVTHPATGERLYRSGDLGRWLPDGSIEILGRKDFQVKIQGQRIELGEIEAALEGLPEVARAVVVVERPAEGRGAARLVAHVVPAAPPAPPPSTGVSFSAEAMEFKLRQAALLHPAPGQAVVPLPEAPADAAAFLARQSHRRFTGEAVPAEDLAALLAGLRLLPVEGAPLPKRLYPSGGSLYPVQTWLHVKPGGVAGIPAGLHYYDPQRHALLPAPADPADGLYGGVNAALLDAAGFVVFLVGCLDAVEPAYPGAGRDFCLIEAGHMGQVLMQAAAAQGIGLCPLGNGVDAARLGAACGFGERHVLAYVLAGGRIEATWSTRWMAYPPPAAAAAAGTRWEERLRAALAARLPAHMIPAAFLRREALPLTANGKLDRRRLMEEGPANVASTEAAPPANETEARLAALLAGLLGIGAVGVHTPFFELGASSVTLVQLRNRIRQEWGRQVPMAELFGRGTVRKLAALLDEAGAPEADAALRAAAEAGGRRARRELPALAAAGA